MNLWYFILTVLFILVSASMVLIILVQRPQGGGLAGAFGGAGGGSTESVFGGRVGDALTVITVAAFIIFLLLAITLNKVDIIAAGATGPNNPNAAAPIIDSSGGVPIEAIPLDGPPPGFEGITPPIPADTTGGGTTIPPTSDPDGSTTNPPAGAPGSDPGSDAGSDPGSDPGSGSGTGDEKTNDPGGDDSE